MASKKTVIKKKAYFQERYTVYFPISDVSQITPDQYTSIMDTVLSSSSSLMRQTGPCITSKSNFQRIWCGSFVLFYMDTNFECCIWGMC